LFAAQDKNKFAKGNPDIPMGDPTFEYDFTELDALIKLLKDRSDEKTTEEK
jgi:hypothetical protein